MEATDNDLVKKVVADITNEERLHAAQFLDLLYTLSPDEKAINEKAADENRELAKQSEAPKPRNGLLQ
jgi:rubrerythrin